MKRPGLSERIPVGDQDNAVGRIPAAVAIPAELQSFSESLLLPDESFRDFEFLRNAIVREVRPERLHRVALDFRSRRAVLGNPALSTL